MSYLGALRLHFAGGFVAAPSTVNNDITHYNNAEFKPEYQLPQDPANLNGWWNPTGDNRFTVDCRATAAGYQDGTAAVADTDPVLTFAVKSINRPNAKIVDLDPQQQMVSMVFGMQLSVGTATGGVPLLKGVFEPAPFTDIWQRGTTGGNDERAGAMYQSVLHSLTWGDVAGSRFLTELKAAAIDGLLSIKFNLDGYSMDSTDPGFTKGRLVGTIGPTTNSEPRHFVVGRHMAPRFNDDPLNRSDFLSLLAWDSFVPDEPPTWHGSMKPLFEQYANLYPAMDAFFDMADYEQVSQKRARVIALMSVPQTDARYMPVTRDLSETKRTAMIRWLSHVGPDGKPLLGTAPSPGLPRNLFTADGVAIGGKARMAERLFGATAGAKTAGTDADQPA